MYINFNIIPFNFKLYKAVLLGFFHFKKNQKIKKLKQKQTKSTTLSILLITV